MKKKNLLVACMSLFLLYSCHDENNSLLTNKEVSSQGLEDSLDEVLLGNQNNTSRLDLASRTFKIIEIAGGVGSCSGSVVSDTGLLLTAAHCIDNYVDPSDIRVYLPHQNREYKASVIKKWNQYVLDAAFLQIQETVKDLKYSRIKEDAPQPNQKVFAITYPGGMQLMQSVGKIKEVEEQPYGFFVNTTTFFGSGSSGGALFSEQGEVLGLTNTHQDKDSNGKADRGSGDGTFQTVFGAWKELFPHHNKVITINQTDGDVLGNVDFDLKDIKTEVRDLGDQHYQIKIIPEQSKLRVANIYSLAAKTKYVGFASENGDIEVKIQRGPAADGLVKHELLMVDIENRLGTQKQNLFIALKMTGKDIVSSGLIDLQEQQNWTSEINDLVQDPHRISELYGVYHKIRMEEQEANEKRFHESSDDAQPMRQVSGTPPDEKVQFHCMMTLDQQTYCAEFQSEISTQFQQEFLCRAQVGNCPSTIQYEYACREGILSSEVMTLWGGESVAEDYCEQGILYKL